MISVILPNYNHAAFLKQRIDSILNQTYKDFELIILDDKSPDNSKDIIEQYRGNEHISHIVYNDVNSGSTFKQWNKGIQIAKGEYIWIAESDDCADNNLLQTLVTNIQKDKNIFISFCQSFEINGQNEIAGDWIFRTQDMVDSEIFNSDFTMNGQEFITKYLIERNVIPNASAVLFKKEEFSKIGNVPSNIGFAGDWLLWLQLLSAGDIAYSHHRYNYFRRHDKSVVVSTTNKKIFLKEYELKMRFAYQKYMNRHNKITHLIKLNKKYIESSSILEARFSWNNKKYIKALKYYLFSIRYSSDLVQVLQRGFKYVFSKK
ncbi:glycosyltransferase [Dysgonomonas sp. ZJ709]|uniref:glycosyltransferase family 2 protein n=1 Tax=Dysgonomonas sp. ZJ709 TaxID=2709797 RepID=UPI0013EC2FDA|nr:glycosyltransferase [Dysgonomonas sp. ZJ709]